jgi:DNA-binding MarR family transcriptional regulator
VDKHNFQTGMNLIREFRKFDSEMPMQMASVFLRVAMQPGITIKELMTLEDISQSSASRNVAALSDWNRAHKPGHGLIKAVEDPYERRRKIVDLTPKGKRVAATMNDLLAVAEGF